MALEDFSTDEGCNVRILLFWFFFPPVVPRVGRYWDGSRVPPSHLLPPV